MVALPPTPMTMRGRLGVRGVEQEFTDAEGIGVKRVKFVWLHVEETVRLRGLDHDVARRTKADVAGEHFAPERILDDAGHGVGPHRAAHGVE